MTDEALDAVERNMVKLRRGMSRQRLGRAAIRDHNLPVDVQVLHVVDVVDEGPDGPGGAVTGAERDLRGLRPGRRQPSMAVCPPRPE